MPGTQPVAPSPRRLGCRELRDLWQGGQRAEAIRSALRDGDRLVGDDEDLLWLQRTLRSCGLHAESMALQAALARRRGKDWEPLIRSVLHSGDPWWARQLLDDAGGGGRERDALRIEVELALGDASESIAAWVRDHRDPAALEAAVSWWVRGGRVDAAERLAADRDLGVWRARFHLWRNEPAAARRRLDGLPPSAEVRCLLAIASVQEGKFVEAEAALRTLLDGAVAAEAASWLATALRKQRRFAEAVRAADAAKLASTETHLAAQLERDLAVEYDTVASAPDTSASATARLLRWVGLRRPRRIVSRPHTIGALPYARALYPLGLRPDDDLHALEPILERFAGNHTPHLTLFEDGTLRSYRPPPDPGQLGSTIRLVLWTRGAGAARALYRDLAASVDDHPHFHNYRGELELWLGDYEAAGRIFRAVLARERKVRWAWIGLGASAMLQGHLREAQRIWTEGVSLTGPGPTLYAYRGECYRRQGELDAARDDLTTALRDKPDRLSARINLALLDGTPEHLRRSEAECAAFAPFLMEELGGTPAERCEQALAAMRGNRSSSTALMSYHLWGHVWRAAD